jgi:tetratricopeptide (TPR) repeat protein
LRDLAGDPWGAIEEFNQAIERNPEDAGLYHERCIALNWTEQYDAAISDCTRSLELDPGNYWNYQELGWIYNGIGDIDSAVENFRIFLGRAPYDESPEAHDDILMWFEEMGIEP